MKQGFFVYALFALILFSAQSFGQSTAMDFTQDECQGNPHQLFTELDAGKVIILEYVMLNCAPCITGTKALENIIKPYENSHPGRVHIYSFGFLNSYTCEQIVAWKNDNEFQQPVFNNGEEQVAYYGGMGMPTMVIVGTNEHKVFFKTIGYTPSVDDEIKAALDSALLYNPTGIYERISSDRFKIYPSVFSDVIHVQADSDLSGSEVVLHDAFGRQITHKTLPENGSLVIPVSGLARGIYFLHLTGRNGSSEGVKLIRQ
jgi:hypothetical protein